MKQSNRLQGRRYLIVARSSSSSQETSVPDQILICRAFGDRMGAIYVDTIEKENLTASNPRNIELLVDELIERKRRLNDFDRVFFYDASRFNRSGGANAWTALNRLTQSSIEAVFATSHIENRRHERMIRHMEFEVANDQVFRSSNTIARGLVSALVAKRRLYCSRRPFGTALGIVNSEGTCIVVIRECADGTQVKVNPLTGEILEQFEIGHRYRKQKYEIPILLPGEPRDVETVGMIYRMHLFDDLGTARIAKALNEQGRLRPGSKPWSAGAVQSTLNTCIYSGIVVAQRISNARFHRTGLQGPIELELGPEDVDPDTGRVCTVVRPGSEWYVVEDERFRQYLPEDVRERAKDHHRRRLERQKHGHKPKPRRDAARESQFILSGILHSAQGHHPMTGTQAGPKGGYRYYKVNRRKVKVEPGSELATRIRADEVEEAVLAAAHQALIADPSVEVMLFDLLKASHTEARRRQERRKALEAELKELQRAAAAAFCARALNPRAADLALADLEPRIESVERELESAAAVPDMTDEQIRREAATMLKAIQEQTGLLREVEPGRAKQLLQALIRDLTIDLATCQIRIELAVPDDAAKTLGPLRSLVYQWLKRTQSDEAVLARVDVPLPDGTCCRRKQRKAA
jgi:hypothetical protein